jgi:hypothetical protein
VTGSSTEEAQRYRRAAEEALHQLEFCVGLLHRLRKDSLASALARNRTTIEQRLRDTDEEFERRG